MVAFVDENDNHIDVMQIADTFIRTTFPTMSSALHHISTTRADLARTRADGDLSWVR
jgi:hypothetical protein